MAQTPAGAALAGAHHSQRPSCRGLTFLGCGGGGLLRGEGLLLGWSRCCSADRHHTRLTCTESPTLASRAGQQPRRRPGCAPAAQAAPFIASDRAQTEEKGRSRWSQAEQQLRRGRAALANALQAHMHHLHGKPTQEKSAISPFCQGARTMMASHKADKIQFASGEKQRSAASRSGSSAQTRLARGAGRVPTFLLNQTKAC